MTALSSHELYSVWRMMRQRCTSPTNPMYEYYGGRGISVCERWLNSFANFLADMGERPPGLTLERKDSNGDYTPNNCIWATRTAQMLNREATHLAQCIDKRGSKYRVRIALNRITHQRSFNTLQEAEDYLADCRFEREMHSRLGLF